jgi:hypothetical protein
MTGNRAKICIAEEKSPVEVRRKSAKYWIFSGLAYLGAFQIRVLAVLMTRRIEIKAPNMVLLIVWCAGEPIVKLNGKSRIIVFSTTKVIRWSLF